MKFLSHSKCLFGTALLTLTAEMASAQELKSSEPITAHVERLLTTAAINYRGLAIFQERGLNGQATLMYGAGAHYSTYSTSGPPLFGSRFIGVNDKYFGRNYRTSGLTPYLFAEYRYYTTLDKRAGRGRDTRANAANYFALVGEVPFATGDLINVTNLSLAYPVGVKYGLRRPLGSQVYLESSLGMMLKLSEGQRALVPRLDVALGWHK